MHLLYSMYLFVFVLFLSLKEHTLNTANKYKPVIQTKERERERKKENIQVSKFKLCFLILHQSVKVPTKKIK